MIGIWSSLGCEINPTQWSWCHDAKIVATIVVACKKAHFLMQSYIA